MVIVTGEALHHFVNREQTPQVCCKLVKNNRLFLP
jgi:hypothetical protein